MRVRLIEVPYHMGMEGVGMGGGPTRLLEDGAARPVREAGATVRVTRVRLGRRPTDTLSALADVNARLARQVAAAVRDGTFPLVLAGNCNSCLGTIAGLFPARVGLVWLDAHGDFHTPETSRTGFLDGMPLAIAAGHCHAALW